MYCLIECEVIRDLTVTELEFGRGVARRPPDGAPGAGERAAPRRRLEHVLQLRAGVGRRHLAQVQELQPRPGPGPGLLRGHGRGRGQRGESKTDSS